MLLRRILEMFSGRLTISGRLMTIRGFCARGFWSFFWESPRVSPSLLDRISRSRLNKDVLCARRPLECCFNEDEYDFSQEKARLRDEFSESSFNRTCRFWRMKRRNTFCFKTVIRRCLAKARITEGQVQSAVRRKLFSFDSFFALQFCHFLFENMWKIVNFLTFDWIYEHVPWKIGYSGKNMPSVHVAAIHSVRQVWKFASIKLI